MEKDKIFFSENGLTVTSANYLANLAKETYKSVEAELSNIVFYNTEVGLLSSQETKPMRIGNTVDDLNAIEQKLDYIAELKSLIAWLREAMKAKSRLFREINDLTDETIATTLGIELPQTPIK